MAEATRPLSVTPGLLDYSLAINRGKHSPRETKVLKRIADDQQMLFNREVKGRMFVCAVLNLYALILYRTGDEQKALRTWEDTLKVDPSNLNALQDLIGAYCHLKDTKNVKKYEQLLKKVTDDKVDKQDREVHLARCKAEQAYAGFCDLKRKTWDNSENWKMQAKMFQEALRLGEDKISQEEKRDWLLYTGQTHEKLARTQFRTRHINSYKDSIRIAFTYLWECLQKSQEPMHKAQAWCALGNAFTEKQEHVQVLESLKHHFPMQRKKLQEMVTNPQSCYEKALHLDERNKVWILARLGICKFKNKDERGALEAFDKSIETAEKLPDNNPMRNACRLAYVYRAMLYVQKSNYEHVSYKKRELLNKAREDTEKAMTMSLHTYLFATLGEVYYLLANLEEDDEKRTLLLEQALIQFVNSLESQDGQSNPSTHVKLAECQDYKGNFPAAADQYLKALYLVNEMHQRYPNFTYARTVAEDLLCTILKCYRNIENQTNLKHDAAIRLQLAFFFIEKYKMRQVIHRITRNGYFEEFVQILHQVMDLDPQCKADCIESCLQALGNIHVPLGEDKVELLNDLSFHYQQWKNRPQVEEDKTTARHTLPCFARNKGFEYDFYVISNDREKNVTQWVKDSLLPRLERCNLKGYYHCKDSKLGVPETTAQESAMSKSCYIIAVITCGFETNPECCNQSSMACTCKLSAPGKVITLKLHNVAVPSFLRHYQCFDYTGQPIIQQLASHMMPKLTLHVQ